MKSILTLSSVAIGERVWDPTSHSVIRCSISNKDSFVIPALALINSDASAYGFVDVEFAHTNDLDLVPMFQPRSLKVFDGIESAHGKISHMAKATVNICGHEERIFLLVTALANFDVVLGLSWLQRHNLEIVWSKGYLEFNQDCCKRNSETFPTKIQAVSPNEIDQRKRRSSILICLIKSMDIDYCCYQDFGDYTKKEVLKIMSVSLEDIQEALKEKPNIDPAEKLPKIYHEYLPVFSRDEADKLPPHRPSDHRIILKLGAELPWGPLYGISREELEVLKKYIHENLEKGYIRPSSSTASSVLFLKKPGGGLRFCVDYMCYGEVSRGSESPSARAKSQETS
ncbi:hypothetical protein K3495_g5967 [Podosphaera aphanis]|nr:hypothetical protein K3495_g5967 [Podosphaera aphanis]